MDQAEWTTEWPTELGFYWFYHDDTGPRHPEKKPSVTMVEVRKLGNGLCYVMHGGMIYPHRYVGYWKKCSPGALPEWTFTKES